MAADGTTTVLKESLPVLAGEVVDGTVMNVAALRKFLAAQVARAKEEGVLFSVHLKATMMKVSDPIIFGHAVRAFFPSVFEAYAAEARFRRRVPERRAAGAVLKAIEALPEDKRSEIEAAVKARLRRGAGHRDGQLRQGHHQPARPERRHRRRVHAGDDPHVGPYVERRRRGAGHPRGPAGQLVRRDLPGRHRRLPRDGAFDPATMGSVANVGLMAQAAEEYGSHDKTFEIGADGVVRVVNAAGDVLLEHEVSTGDIWRACQTKDVPIRDWVKLAVTRARATGVPAVFWLDEGRAHDANLIGKVKEYLGEHDTEGLDIEILKPTEAIAFSSSGSARARTRSR